MIDRFRIGTKIDGGEVADTGAGLIYAWRSDFPVMMNGAIALPGGSPEALLDAARQFFAERSRGFTFFVRTDEDAAAADAAGMHQLIEHYPAMVRRTPFGPWDVPDGVELRRVSDDAVARDYAGVADAAFPSIGMPAGLLADMPPETLLRDDTAAFVAYADGRPVASASVLIAQGIGGIQWVAVVEQARRRGLAALCTAAAADAGFALGAEVAWLEASHMGEPVYARMGFEEVFSYRLYVAASPPG
jgi:GNAT superfamily N-acetyltransferase